MDAGHLLFAHAVRRDERAIDLGAAALLVAEPEYPALDVARYGDLLDIFADGALGSVQRGESPRLALARHLHGELGFAGNETDYYDPRNSFFNEVLDRRVGIPITLSLLHLEVGRRMGLSVEGVAFPGHFLVRYLGVAGDHDEVVVDPYHGGIALDQSALVDRLRRVAGQGATLTASHLARAGKRQILARLLNNLRGVYQRSGDAQREQSVVERLELLGAAGTHGQDRGGRLN
ncbi:MAG: hypothetical protein EXR73_12275 [Myxococcales bacterium]|nr:hypothetical protein [Myxococcales bacterium]